ncbi:MAG: carbon-nitrogen hydrolase family protein [Campylobacterota bacterium]|nr:carbon-nitrogen hydrolase family protein [Campylobacterota bacterium]
MKQKELTAITLQLQSSSIYQENLDRLLCEIQNQQESIIIVAPEVYLTAYDYDHIEAAANFSANALNLLQEVINEQILVFTLILKEEDTFVNQAVVIHRHKIIYRQNKAKLFKLGDEHLYLEAGSPENIVPFEIEGLKYALLICFELRFKALWRQIEGVDIVLIPARWGLPRKKHLEILSKGLAVMNQCFVLLANSSDADMASSSAIISPDGEEIADDEKEVIKSDLDLSEIKKMRRYITMD